MIDREYVKLNTSIQTGSNSQNLIRDEDGNIEATIELRLPDSLFNASTGGKTVDRVEMLPTKMRLSLNNTPIAKIPISPTKRYETAEVSTSQMDIYPFSLLNDETFLPRSLNGTPFPYYKNHYLNIEIKVYTDDLQTSYTIETMRCTCNSPLNSFPKQSRFYDFLINQNNLGIVLDHPMNLVFN